MNKNQETDILGLKEKYFDERDIILKLSNDLELNINALNENLLNHKYTQAQKIAEKADRHLTDLQLLLSVILKF